jgi:hypothetical protein
MSGSDSRVGARVACRGRSPGLGSCCERCRPERRSRRPAAKASGDAARKRGHIEDQLSPGQGRSDRGDASEVTAVPLVLPNDPLVEDLSDGINREGDDVGRSPWGEGEGGAILQRPRQVEREPQRARRSVVKQLIGEGSADGGPHVVSDLPLLRGVDRGCYGTRRKVGRPGDSRNGGRRGGTVRRSGAGVVSG